MGKLENTVTNAVIEACAFYRVPCFRIQSRVLDVPNGKGGTRPIKIGEWRDEFGESHTSGMADLLLMPRIRIPGGLVVAVPLWTECKYGKNGLSESQFKFCRYVESCGAYYLVARDSADSVLEWFELHGVKR